MLKVTVDKDNIIEVSEMNNEKVNKLRSFIQPMFIIVALAVVCLVVFKCAPDILELLKSGDEEAMEEYIKGTGNKGIIVIVLLQILQTLTIVFPGIPIYICSGIVFGRLKGTLICYITYVAINIVIFGFSRSMGAIADTLFPAEDDKGVEELLGKSKHPMLIIMALCVVPVIPNGIIPHIAAKSNISFKEFSVAVSIGCIPGIFLFVFCGELILNGYFGLIMGLCVFAIVLMVVTYLFKDKLGDIATRIMMSKNGNK